MVRPMPKGYTGLKREPLRFDEYEQLRNLFGTLMILEHAEESMQDRLKLIPFGKRDMAMIFSQFSKLLQNLVNTTPQDRLIALSNELEHTHMEVKTTKPKPGRLANGTTYVPIQPLERVIDKAVSMECFCCEKCGRDVLNCQLRQDVQQIYHYDFPKEWKNGCPLAQHMEIKEVFKHDSSTKTSKE